MENIVFFRFLRVNFGYLQHVFQQLINRTIQDYKHCYLIDIGHNPSLQGREKETDLRLAKPS